jgi:hypothetical protein
VSWRLDAGHGALEVTVPDDTIADVVLPDGATDTVGPGRHRLPWSVG